MSKGSPIKLTIYGPDDEIVKECSRSIIPWKFLKRAIKLAKLMDTGEPTEEDLDMLGQLVVDFYGEQFTLAELENGADVNDMLIVLQAIISQAGELTPKNSNPTHPRP